jgi:hypothetical protein
MYDPFFIIHQYSKPLLIAEKGAKIDRKRRHPSSDLDFRFKWIILLLLC